MRTLPTFTKDEIDYLYGLICKSQTELFQEKGMPCKSFTPFKNNLLNKVKKYEHILDEKKYHSKEDKFYVDKDLCKFCNQEITPARWIDEQLNEICYGYLCGCNSDRRSSISDLQDHRSQ